MTNKRANTHAHQYMRSVQFVSNSAIHKQASGPDTMQTMKAHKHPRKKSNSTIMTQLIHAIDHQKEMIYWALSINSSNTSVHLLCNMWKESESPFPAWMLNRCLWCKLLLCEPWTYAIVLLSKNVKSISHAPLKWINCEFFRHWCLQIKWWWNSNSEFIYQIKSFINGSSTLSFLWRWIDSHDSIFHSQSLLNEAYAFRAFFSSIEASIQTESNKKGVVYGCLYAV